MGKTMRAAPVLLAKFQPYYDMAPETSLETTRYPPHERYLDY